MSLMAPDLTDAEFQSISEVIHGLCGIRLPPGKEGLVRTRLSKRLKALGLPSYKSYLDHVAGDGGKAELTAMVDALTTNKTSFFREQPHFDFFREEVIPHLRNRRDPIRIWCAGCSSGEEPYSVAILLAEELPDVQKRDVRILATDISTRMVERAREGVYSEAVVAEVPPALRSRYFREEEGEDGGASFRVQDSLRGMVTVGRLNLMAEWPMRGPFSLILCRNVMIYFGRDTQEGLVGRFHRLLEIGGHLFVGHSESLSSLAHDFTYVRPAIYRR